MHERLISGYAAYTTATEYGADAVGDAPATTPLAVTISLISASVVADSLFAHC